MLFNRITLRIKPFVTATAFTLSALCISSCNIANLSSESDNQSQAAPVEETTTVSSASETALIGPTIPESLLSKRIIIASQQHDAATNSVAKDKFALKPVEIVVKPTDLWDRVRKGFALKHPINNRVMAELRYYKRHKSYLDRIATRSDMYLYHIVEEAEKRNIPLEIALLPVVESAFQPFAYSHGRASGIWQFIPSTGKLFGLKQNWWYDGRRDIVASTDAALTYLEKLAKRFNGDWLLALASYNSGAGTVNKAIRRNKKRGLPTDYWSLSLPKETEMYVPRLIAFCMLIDNPKNYGIGLKSVSNKPYFSTVKLKNQIDLSLAADLAEISTEQLYKLNPGYNRWATPPKGPHILALPIESIERFETKLAALPKDKRVRWIRHRIKTGEALLTIAKKYDTTVQVIRSANNIRGNNIRAGTHLVIPVSLKSEKEYTHSLSQRQQGVLSRARSRSSVIHIVKKGDTLWDIAQKYKVSVGSITRLNKISPRDTLRNGQKLAIKPSHKTPRRYLSGTPGSITKRVTYTVRKGDSLDRIARKFKVTVQELKSWNRVARTSKYLQPGQRLKIYVDVANQSA
ncbi:MAG: LysM peptidoglycan-binding domain-containing protein [Gammaproteobacteria bacterium]|nr:MAG: LysM peptidoglycan-binding domain-containing protein [Gammaproteobacteria bacterium]